MIKLRPPAWGAPRTRKSFFAALGTLFRRLWRLAVHANDQPNKIARGFALGLFIGWLPLVGIQTIIAALLCWPLRANFAATIPGVWMSNPLTIVPMYLLNNWCGSLIYGKRISWAEMEEIWAHIATLGIWEAMVYLCVNVWHVTAPMLIGGVFIGIAVSTPGYFMALRAAYAVQRRRRQRRTLYRTATDQPVPNKNNKN